MTREQLKTGIQIAARICELRRLAADTSKQFEQALAESGLPRQHFALRLMLLGRLPPPPKSK